MSKRDKDRKALSINLPARAGYDVGYAKPPAVSRFQPGRSGNPRGRPKGAKNKTPALNEERLKDIILAEAYRSIKVRDGEKSVSVPIAQAVVRSLAVNAAKGQHRAQLLFAQLLGATEAANKRLHDEWLETAIEYKVDWERELERRRERGIEAPEPIPPTPTTSRSTCAPARSSSRVLSRRKKRPPGISSESARPPSS